MTDAKSNDYETALLKLLFQNTVDDIFGDIGSGIQAATSAGALYISLHTASPGETGNQASSEATFTGYTRELAGRNSLGWSVSGNTADNGFHVYWDKNSGSSQTITHFGIGTTSSGPGFLLYYGALASSVTLDTDDIMNLQLGALDVTES